MLKKIINNLNHENESKILAVTFLSHQVLRFEQSPRWSVSDLSLI